jgi:hypothetical protein
VLNFPLLSLRVADGDFLLEFFDVLLSSGTAFALILSYSGEAIQPLQAC